MINTEISMNNEEKIVLPLRSLFEKYGYSQYKMTKFEEYDLYVRNKDFLLSDNIITFNDTNGKLMALKPDVTLSIIKNSNPTDSGIKKLYYHENVYRVSNRSNSFREIPQIGLECLGNIDTYNIAETIVLAAKSLKMISPKCILSISNLDIVSYVLDLASTDEKTKLELVKYIGEKNIHQLAEICETNGILSDIKELLIELTSTHGKPEIVLPKLHKMFPSCCAVDELEKVINSLCDSVKDILDIDFSYVSDIKYYNGILFKGFIDGIPSSVISGGQYDKLLNKMGRKSKAIGFAIYIDALERVFESNNEYDVDVLIIYNENTDVSLIGNTVEKLTGEGKKVLALSTCPENLKYKELVKLN